MNTIKVDQLQLPTSEIYRAMGSGISSHKASPVLLQKIEQHRLKALTLLECKYACKILTVDGLFESYVLLQDTFRFVCNPKYFQGATQVAVIVLTVGPAVEQEIKRLLIDKFLLDGLILDAYANTALDELFGHIRSQLLQEFSPSKLGYSLCPGCLLPMEDQLTVFSILEKEFLEMGIVLRDSFAMSPEKSCTYLIPIGKNLLMSSNSRYACSICPSHHTCLFSPVGKTK